MNYCHDLEEGGYQDWRVPSYGELDAAYTGASTHFGIVAREKHWSSTSDARDGRAYTRDLTTGDRDDDPKGNHYAVVCVRDGS